MTSQLSGEAKKEQKDQAPDYFSSKEADSSNSAEPATPSTPSAATGLMGRLRFGLKSPRAEKALAVEKPVEKALEKVDSQNEVSLLLVMIPLPVSTSDFFFSVSPFPWLVIICRNLLMLPLFASSSPRTSRLLLRTMLLPSLSLLPSRSSSLNQAPTHLLGR